MSLERHPLQPLLAPRSIAIVGASTRPDTPGNDAARQLRKVGFDGAVFPVTPRYDAVEGFRSYPSLAELPSSPDLAIIALSNDKVEEQLATAIRSGARAAGIFASCYLPEDRDPPLTRRLADMAREAQLPICGANCIGFFNFDSRAACTWFPISERDAGSIAFISHSGAVFCAMVDLDFRLRFNIAVSAGQELSTTVAEYMDYAIDMPTTRVVALFLETVRRPREFIAALEKAQVKNIPVVVLKIGRTSLSARLAESHSGAIAGDDAAYQAVFDRYNVIRVRTTEELAATALLFSSGRQAADGGLSAIMDSGGARGLMIDLASDLKLPFAKIGADTRGVLASKLEHGLEPVNPLDAWGSGKDYEAVYRDCFSALMADKGTGAGVFLYDMAIEDYISHGFTRALLAASVSTDKPVMAVTNLARLPRTKLVKELDRAGVPVIDGLEPALMAAKHAFAHRDGRLRPRDEAPPGPGGCARERWLARLSNGKPLDEMEGFRLLGDYGIPVIPAELVLDRVSTLQAARRLGYPVALKTTGHDHKTEVGGVKLNLTGEEALGAAYDDMAQRLGPRVIVSPMAKNGVEMALGIVVDPQFGPLVMAAAGGVMVELLRDARFALAPLGRAEALRLIDGLKSRPLLDGFRGRAAADKAALADALCRLSRLADDLAAHLASLDVNPFILGPSGGVAVDALVKPL